MNLILTLTFLIILTGIIYNYRRRQLPYFELKPNILLCKYPIDFITAEQSLFYFGNYYNSIPEYLYEHGYIVHIVSKFKILKNLPKNSSYYLFMSEEILSQLIEQEFPVQILQDSRILILSNQQMPEEQRKKINRYIIEHKLKIDEFKLDQFKESYVDQFFLFLHRLMRKDSISSPHSLGLVKNSIQLKQLILNHFVELAEIEYYNSNQQL